MHCITAGLLGAVLFGTAGCASNPPASGTTGGSEKPGVIGYIGDVTGKALEAVGLKKPESPELPEHLQVPDSALPDWRVSWRLYASDALNTDDSGQSLALLVRLYRLKSADAFLHAPYDTFGDPIKEKQALGEDLLSVREVQLLPGQRHDAVDKIARQARYIGIVALYRNPSAGRWRHAFSSEQAAISGLHIGLHACTISVQLGDAIDTSAHRARSASAPCP